MTFNHGAWTHLMVHRDYLNSRDVKHNFHSYLFMAPDFSRSIRIGKETFDIVCDDDYLANIGQDFEPHTISLLDCITPEGAVAFDIGANIGLTTLFLSQKAKQVVAFEPSPTTFSFLKRNIEQSRSTNVNCLNIALGREEGTSSLTFAPSNRSGAFVSDKTQASDGHTIEPILVRALDDVIREIDPSAVDVLKIDVEGYEASVLGGGVKTLQRFRPVVMFELNHWCLNVMQRTSLPDFLDNMRSIFPILIAIQGNSYLDLHDSSASYSVMYQHIINSQYNDLVGAFDPSQIAGLKHKYKNGPA